MWLEDKRTDSLGADSRLSLCETSHSENLNKLTDSRCNKYNTQKSN